MPPRRRPARGPRRSLRSTGIRYALDGSRRTEAQAARDAIADGISKAWLPLRLDGSDDRRPNHKPRGIENPSVSCYMNSVFQSLMHTPIFLNWIRTHVADADCAAGNCLKCDMKGFIGDYWGPDRSSLPISANNTHLVNIKNKAWATPLLEANRMEDPNQVYEGFLFSEEHGLPIGSNVWRKQFDAIFSFERDTFISCYECGIERKTLPDLSKGLDVNIYPQWPPIALFNTVSDAINETFQHELLEDCRCETPSCERLRLTKYAGKMGPPHFRRQVLTMAPSVLKIRLTIGTSTHRWTNQEAGKIFHTWAIDETLDLTRYQEDGPDSALLTYRLSAVVSHSGGSLEYGHYIASVRSPARRPFYTISDAVWVEPIDLQQFIDNPQQNDKTEEDQYQVYTLTYLKDEQSQPVVSERARRALRELGHVS